METYIKRFLEAPGKQIVLYIAGGVASVLMAVVILCNLLLIVSNIREPKQMPSVFGVRPAIVLSGSMSPAFEAGDMILLKKTKEPDKLEVGDVACYLYSGKATTHRVIERFEAEGKPRYIMKGDYNNVEDRLAVDPEQIQGVWTGGRIRRLGSFLMFLQSTMGMFIFLICPLAGLLCWDIVKRRRMDRLRPEWQGDGDQFGTGYERYQRTAGGGGIAALRGFLGHGAVNGERREEEESPEEEIPRPVRRRPPVSAEEKKDHVYGGGEPRELREQAAGRIGGRSRSRPEPDDEFYYYSRLDEELDYYQELEEAAEHYRKMKESLKRYRRMEAVMNRCRRLEEELSRYEALAERLEAFERQNRNGVSNQGTRRRPPVDHIERTGGTTPPTDE